MLSSIHLATITQEQHTMLTTLQQQVTLVRTACLAAQASAQSLSYSVSFTGTFGKTRSTRTQRLHKSIRWQGKPRVFARMEAHCYKPGYWPDTTAIVNRVSGDLIGVPWSAGMLWCTKAFG
jgi:hypothetical protein